MLKYMEFVESLIKNLYLFQQELSNCIDTPSAGEKVKSVTVKEVNMRQCYRWNGSLLLMIEELHLPHSDRQKRPSQKRFMGQ